MILTFALSFIVECFQFQKNNKIIEIYLFRFGVPQPDLHQTSWIFCRGKLIVGALASILPNCFWHKSSKGWNLIACEHCGWIKTDKSVKFRFVGETSANHAKHPFRLATMLGFSIHHRWYRQTDANLNGGSKSVRNLSVNISTHIIV